MNRKKVILLVEDNPDLNEINRRALEDEGYEVLTALTLGEARGYLEQREPDVILLDVLLPDGNGMDFCAEIRESTSAHIIFITSRVDGKNKVRGLNVGGDDYITKPYLLSEMLARVRAAIRRQGMESPPRNIEKGGLTLDIFTRRAYIGDIDLGLAQVEFNLLLVLAQNEGQELNAEALYENAWGQPMSGNKNALQKSVSRLRSKIKPTGFTISSIYGKGRYVFETA